MSRARYRADRTVRRVGPAGRTVLGGSPVRLLRLGAAGARVLDDALSGSRRSDSVPGGADLLDRLEDAGVIHPTPTRRTGAPRPPVEVSVVVPVRDDAEGLQALLRSLTTCDTPPAEVLVVDDGSADADEVGRVVGDVAGGRRPTVAVLRHEDPRGPAAARNAGLVRARHEVVALLDADCVVAGDWLAPLLAHLDEPRVALVAPRVRAGGPAPGALVAHDAVRGPLDLGAEPARVAPGTRVAYVPSAASVVRRDVVVGLGGFDESLRVGEDVDLVWRLLEAGHRARYEPAATVRHRVRPSLRAWVAQRVAYGTSAARLDRRHPGRVAPAVLSPWSAAVCALAAAGRPRAAALLAWFTARRLRDRLGDLPPSASLRLVALGHLGAARQLCRAAARQWWPVAAAAAASSARARRLVAVTWAVAWLPESVRVLAGPGPDALADGGPGRPTLPDRILAAALVPVDDLAHGVGVWQGCRDERSLRSLLPRRG